MLKQVKLEALGEFDPKIPIGFDRELAIAVADCLDRPAVHEGTEFGTY